jgi:hypothetical protein
MPSSKVFFLSKQMLCLHLVVILFLVACVPNQVESSEVRNIGEGSARSAINNQDCNDLPIFLESCTIFTCRYKHPNSGNMLTKQVLGLEQGTCKYFEELPGNQQMECLFNEPQRLHIARYYGKLNMASSNDSTHNDQSSPDSNVASAPTSDSLEDPMSKAVRNGTCYISEL